MHAEKFDVTSKQLDGFAGYDDNMNKEEAKAYIRRLANEGSVGFTNHCSAQMTGRNVTTDDFLQVLMWGNVLSVDKDLKTGDWKCKIEGKDIDGDTLRLIGAIDDYQGMVVCVTVF